MIKKVFLGGFFLLFFYPKIPRHVGHIDTSKVSRKLKENWKTTSRMCLQQTFSFKDEIQEVILNREMAFFFFLKSLTSIATFDWELP